MAATGRRKSRDAATNVSSEAKAQLSPQLEGADRLSAIEKLPGVVVYQRLVTPDGQIRYTYISENAHELFGVPADEILSDPRALFSCHSHDYSAKFRERLLAASKGLTNWDVEASIVSRDGRKKYTHAIAQPNRRPDGSVLWTGIILDETRTRAGILEGLSGGILLFDLDDRMILRNNGVLELLPNLRDVAVPGAQYADVIRAELASGNASETTEVAEAKLEAEFISRMEAHREPRAMSERQIGGDRWILVNEQRTDEGTILLYTDISDLKRGERQIRHLAYHDALTGLSNRIVFHQRIDEALGRARERGTTVAILCLDLDNFKNVNDTLGHPAGDELLKVVAARLRSCLRDTDTVARLGGDEFGIVVTDLSDADYAATLAWRLLDVVSQPIDLDGQQAITTVSIGIVVSGSEIEPNQLLKNADLALYRAKADGRATFRFFEAEMDARAQERRALEMDLRHAIAKGQLEVHYQPQIDLYSDEVLGFEALVRWRHPIRGLISPGEFIPLAEETGIIMRLGEWVMRQACADAAHWPKPVKVAVNVSPAQFKDNQLAVLVAEILNETGLAPERLEIEITESLLLRNAEANIKILEELRRFGVRISMDDFGTGYSSLQNLRSFPFDKIKIDQSFVSDLERRPDAPAIIRAVLGLGQSLGMITCAEGVETPEQVAYLRAEGCTEVQGYYYGKPAPVGDAIRLLNSELANAPDGGSDSTLADRPETAQQPKQGADRPDPVAAYITAVTTSVET